MRMPPERLGGFVLRTAAWLPPCLAAWYAVARYHAVLVGWGASLLANALSPQLVSSVERDGATLQFVTRIVVHPTPDTTGVLVPEVNPLLYTFGIAFFVALMLASRSAWWKIALGLLVLLPFQAWGAAFDLLAQLAVRLGPLVSVQAGLMGWKQEAIALGYQAGSLIFPPVVPVVLWGVFNRPFLERLRSPARTQALSP